MGRALVRLHGNGLFIKKCGVYMGKVKGVESGVEPLVKLGFSLGYQ